MTAKKDEVLADGFLWIDTLMRERNEIERGRNDHLRSIAESLREIVVKIPKEKT